MATDPTFFSNPIVQGAQIAAAASAYGGTRAAPTGLTTIFNGDATNDRLVNRISVKGMGVTVAGLFELWLYNGTTHYLIPGVSAPIIARTPSTTIDPWHEVIEPKGGIFLPGGGSWELRAGVSVSQTGGLSIVTYGAEA